MEKDGINTTYFQVSISGTNIGKICAMLSAKSMASQLRVKWIYMYMYFIESVLFGIS